MTFTPILVILVVLSSELGSQDVSRPSRSGKESWEEAYRKGNYKKAADLLHPLVVEQLSDPGADDPTAARQLAALYATGRGVTYDPIAAGSIVLMAQSAASAASHRHLPDLAAYDASLRNDARIVAERCDGLAERERVAGHRSLGCFAFGLTEQIVRLGQDLVWIGRGGIRLADDADETIESLPGCPQLVARVRPLSIDPPPGAAAGVTTRHFIELLAWSRTRQSSEGFDLELHLYELRGRGVVLIPLEQLRTSVTWPDPPLPREIDEGLSFEMTSSGVVRWRLDGSTPKSGEIPPAATR